MTTYALPTVGVEEEFLLVDAYTLRPTAANEAVIAHAQNIGIDAVSELTELQVETNSPPLQRLRELREHVISTRTMLSAIALSHDVRLLATGVSPVARAEPGPMPITDGARYRKLAETYGALADSVATCGGHIHVEVPNKATAVQVCNFVRPWLPTLLAMTSNSSIHDGSDTRHASWRSTVWGRWPSAGPPPYLNSADHYDDLVASMIRSGVILDEAALYWDVRPSIHQPTIEVRVGDVPSVADEVALSAALVRGLVMTAISSIERGERAPVLDGHHLAAAYHRAQVHGMTGDGVDPFTGKLAPASSLLRSLVRGIRPALTAAGDARYVETSLERLRHLGNGAQRQREILSRTGDPVAVASLAARCTTSDWSASVAHTAT
ncbi:glutamate--cysteine ligase [Rhodococcus fascians]|nr:glutamate--cysteine ligase [Rhodococcus fascians]MBY4235879.1 glutamate--cysteine ligase [Rhodococcus fascians]MBY4251570.1 glutamate--cysteine ligase [Rhodococcus fascians]MBY4267225.1 glutamate--cysteine ligase [Rhodococcus fascians]MBY4275309.1 glutamate--cysteine ligase [Rhodococcus fascians]